MIKVRVERAWARDGYNLWIIEYDQFRKITRVAEPIILTMKELETGWQLPAPSLELASAPLGIAEDLLRGLVEGIMEAGLVPMTSKDNAKQVEAMEANLKDLREIVKPLINFHTGPKPEEKP